jgi:hypothetical protein
MSDESGRYRPENKHPDGSRIDEWARNQTPLNGCRLDHIEGKSDATGHHDAHAETERERMCRSSMPELAPLVEIRKHIDFEHDSHSEQPVYHSEHGNEDTPY